jgi:predicted Zn-ribbon and HTH transcriptional regulator
MNATKIGEAIPELYALADRLGGLGQYNNAKLVRAAAEAITRRAGYDLDLPTKEKEIAQRLEAAVLRLADFEVTATLAETLKKAAMAMEEGRLPMFDEAPHAYVCRTCGYVVTDVPAGVCPTCNARPQTFKEFLPVYWMEHFDPFEALDSLRSTPQTVADSIDGLTEVQLNKAPEEAAWSIRNTVAHLRDAQGVFEFRIGRMIEQDNPALPSQAVFDWATRESDQPPATEEIFRSYAGSRQRVIQRLENLALKDWWRGGRHEEFGPVTIKQQASYFATHELSHLPQIERLVGWVRED